MIIRKHMIFFGRVQGVGFRYCAYYAANGLGLTGFVENRYDGTVELEVQGEDFEIERFVDEIRAGAYIRMVYIEMKTIPNVEESGYTIKN